MNNPLYVIGRIFSCLKKINIRITLISLDGIVLADSHKDYRLMENHSSRPEVIEPVILLNRKLLVKEMNPAAEKLINNNLVNCRKKSIRTVVKNDAICNLAVFNLISNAVKYFGYAYYMENKNILNVLNIGGVEPTDRTSGGKSFQGIN